LNTKDAAEPGFRFSQGGVAEAFFAAAAAKPLIAQANRQCFT